MQVPERIEQRQLHNLNIRNKYINTRPLKKYSEWIEQSG